MAILKKPVSKSKSTAGLKQKTTKASAGEKSSTAAYARYNNALPRTALPIPDVTPAMTIMISSPLEPCGTPE